MRIFLISAIVVAASGSCLAAEIKTIAGKDGRSLITLSGEINVGDADLFKAAVKSANDAGKFVANIRLNSIGGNLVEGVKLADTVRFGKISTNVGKDATCASACFLVFAAGATKFANYTAQIGVHGASTSGGEEAGDGTVAMARVAKELGVPAAIIGRMVVTPPSEMVWLTPQDLQSMGTSMLGKPDQLAAATSSPSAAPSQTKPGEPLQLGRDVTSQNTSASLSPEEKWKRLVSGAVDLSAQQNGGKARTVRNCQPELKLCNTGVYFKLDGNDAVLLKREDVNGYIVKKELCTFNSYGDTRWCWNVDTDKRHRDMKDSKGEWNKVADD
ncbi:MAG: hypothetical protein J0I29_12425 [Rhizobiales bacterium]|nr:hypothetical protein [Hyphomicrobiales bacterium]